MEAEIGAHTGQMNQKEWPGGDEIKFREKYRVFYKLRKIALFIYLFIFLEKALAPTLVLSPGRSRGRRSLIGYSPWGRKESDMTEQLHFHFSFSCSGGGNGNPLQCSCLENPRDRGAWWAAVYGVAQIRIRLM